MIPGPKARITYDRRVAIDRELANQSVCDLETTGRVSGMPRVVEMWFAADPNRDRIYVLSGGRDRAHWVRNLRQEPAVRVRIGRREFAGRGAEIEGGADDVLARRLLAAKYQGWSLGDELSGWARDSLPVAIDLVEAG
jgi:deazaflavin-dependent oxidoreductase (nitroreductase family)